MKTGNEVGKPNTVLAVETCETLLSLYGSRTVVHIFRYYRAFRLTHTRGRNQKRENDLRFSENAADKSTRWKKSVPHDSTFLVVTT